MTQPFLFVGGSLAFDFVNTELIDGDRRTDTLARPSDLHAWAHAVGHELGGATEEDLAAARGLRGAVRALFEAHLDGTPPPPDQVERVDQALLRPGPVGGLRRTAEGYAVRARPLETGALLRLIAEDAAQALITELDRFGRCANDHCILLFIDRSRRGNRRWCSMQICGNRAKVRAHRDRHRG